LKEFDLDYMSLRKLTEHLSLQVSPERCTHQSIEQVDVYSIRSTRTGARTPPPTLLFPSQQCQRANVSPGDTRALPQNRLYSRPKSGEKPGLCGSSWRRSRQRRRRWAVYRPNPFGLSTCL